MTSRRRVYPLESRALSEEQIAVTFAMTSRRPEPFDETARQVSEATAADFHERWVVGYGHASVAEHAVVRLAVENISRIAADALEDGRLASYTEKSSRYQVMPQDGFHIPEELEQNPIPLHEYRETCRMLFRTYENLLAQTLPRGRRAAIDACRAVLPAAVHTNVGLTANARSLERIITKLMSSPILELQSLGREVREQGRTTAPTLIKYAGENRYEKARSAVPRTPPPEAARPSAKLISHDPEAEHKIAAALLYRAGGPGYEEARRQAGLLTGEERAKLIDGALAQMGEHDQPPREFETAAWQFEFVMDYGALREFRRHRMMTHITQPLTVGLGLNVPVLLREAGLERQYAEAAKQAEAAHRAIAEEAPSAAGYLVTHGHLQRTLATLNLRQLWHLARLRASPQAHEAVRAPVKEALRLAEQAHPALFRGLRLREQ